MCTAQPPANTFNSNGMVLSKRCKQSISSVTHLELIIIRIANFEDSMHPMGMTQMH
jgi:hypothetical protein